jgi:hypothetical protein
MGLSLPALRGKRKVISFEHQVRIAAALLSVLGIIAMYSHACHHSAACA